MTDYLSVEDLAAVALRAVGPGAQVSDWGLLVGAAARPRASAFGEDAYPEFVNKAAALLVDLDPRDVDAAFAFVMAVADGSLGDDLTKVLDVLRPWLR